MEEKAQKRARGENTPVDGVVIFEVLPHWQHDEPQVCHQHPELGDKVIVGRYVFEVVRHDAGHYTSRLPGRGRGACGNRTRKFRCEHGDRDEQQREHERNEGGEPFFKPLTFFYG